MCPPLLSSSPCCPHPFLLPHFLSLFSLPIPPMSSLTMAPRAAGEGAQRCLVGDERCNLGVEKAARIPQHPLFSPPHITGQEGLPKSPPIPQRGWGMPGVLAQAPDSTLPLQAARCPRRACSCTAPSPGNPSASVPPSRRRSSCAWSGPSRRTTTWWAPSASSWPAASASPRPRYCSPTPRLSVPPSVRPGGRHGTDPVQALLVLAGNPAWKPWPSGAPSPGLGVGVFLSQCSVVTVVPGQGLRLGT